MKICVACLLNVMISSVCLAASLEKMNISSPPPEVSADEKLGSRESINRQCAELLARSLAAYPGIQIHTEVISYSDKFGYIFRYAVSQEPGNHRAGHVLVAWSRDCKNLQFAIYPTFALPTQSTSDQ